MTKFNFKFISKTLGILLVIESIFIFISAIISYYYKEHASESLLISGGITAFSGIILGILAKEKVERPIGLRESYVLVTLTWIVLSLFGMLPFYIYGATPSIIDAYFETISGFTTTGLTILRDVESLPKGLLFWRSLTQWIGGMGIVVFALAILPMLGGNASALFDAEASGINQDRFQPRVTKVAKQLWLIYIVITGMMVLALYAGSMDVFDAICHSFTTLATGGYSTKQSGIFYWNSSYIQYVTTIFMFIGGVNFTLLYFASRGKFRKLIENEELKWYTIIMACSVVFVAAYLFFSGKITDPEVAFRHSLFQIVSVSTSTGFTAPDYILWGAFPFFVMCFSMFFCACVGSTSGGAKIVRLVVFGKSLSNEFTKQVHPNAVLPIRMDKTILPTEVVNKILAFLFLYIVVAVVSTIVLSIDGMGIEGSIGNTLSALGNVGAAFGEQGVEGHFANVSTFSKIVLSFTMIVGRLELFTALSLFMPAFWKK